MTVNRLNGHSKANHSPTDDKLPISNTRAEMAYIGSALYDQHILDEAPVSPGWFYLDSHQKIVRLMQNKHQDGKAVDFLTLSAELVPLGESMTESEWDGILTECFNSAIHAEHAAYYAGIVQERFIRRSACYEARTLQHELYESQDVQAIISRHVDSLERLNEASDSNEAIDCTTGLNSLLATWKTPDSQGIPTGYHDIDALIGGFQPQRLYLLAAKTAIGKSALAINFAAHVARSVHVLFVSLEMPPEEVFARLVSSVTRKPTDTMRTTVYVDQDTSEVTESLHAVSQLKFRADDRGGRTIASITAQARKLHRKKLLGLLIVDHVGLVVPADARSARYEQLGTISRGLKLLAKNLKIPVLALSQLSRQADGDGVRPQLYHLRESGNLEQDSDVVMLIHRDRHATETELLIEKNRSGRVGSVKLDWNPEIVRYDSAATTWQNCENYDPLGDQ